MLKFFRDNAAIIGWVIVIFFGVTMFAGSVFLGFGNNTPAPKPSAVKNNFASLGEYPISIKKYNQFIRVFLQGVTDYTQLSPLQLESLKLQAFNKTLENHLFYVATQEDNIVLSKVERESMEKEFLLENNFKSKADLKKTLKENNVKYKDFKLDIEEEFLIRKLKSDLMSSVNVNDALIDNSFKSFKYDIVLVTSSNIYTEKFDQVVQQIGTQLNDSLDFDFLQDKFESVVSISYLVGPDYRPFLELNQQFQEVLSTLVVDEFSKPIYENDSCLFVKLNNVEQQARPDDFNEQDYVDSITAQLQEQRLSDRIRQIYDNNELIIFDAAIRSVYFKSIGKFDESLLAYGEIESTFPSSSVPNFFKAELLYRLGQVEEAKIELEKAALKARLDEANSFPEIYLFYGDLLIQEADRDLALAQYEIAQALVNTNLAYLKQLQQRYSDFSFLTQLDQVEVQIAMLEAQAKAELEAAEAEQLADESNMILEDDTLSN